jgi:ubiquinone/menaquinone biosynthesis C-methylase UbiE
MNSSPPVCDYEGSHYQEEFWERGQRAYEDACEAQTLRRLLPRSGQLLLELGAGAGRNTSRYTGYDRIVLLDYSRTQLAQARERLGDEPRYTYVAANIYRLPFVDGLFDGTTLIRTLHHLAQPAEALIEIRRVLAERATFVLEYANKHNLKAIARYVLRRQTWSPNSLAPIEFAPLNFDFHPQAVRAWLTQAGFRIERQVTVSHFRVGWMKRALPTRMLVALDRLAGTTGDLWQLSPSVFARARAVGASATANGYFQCPACGGSSLEEVALVHGASGLRCSTCQRLWPLRNGIYDFKEAIEV